MTTTKNPTELWPSIVGQTKAKRRLGFYIDGYKGNNICPHLMFIAPKGCGKTMMSKAMGKHLNNRGSEKTKNDARPRCQRVSYRYSRQ